MRSLALLPTLPLVLTACHLCACQTEVHETDQVKSGPWPAGAALAVETDNGAIRVTPGEGTDYKVVATLRSPSEERLARTAVRIAEADGVMRVSIDWPEGRTLSNEGCSLVIRVPAAAGLQLRTSNGSIEFGGFACEAVATTSNGRISAMDLDGPAELVTSNGGIEARGIGGRLRAETSNGSIKAELRPDNAGPVTLRSSNGGITVDASALAGVIMATTSNGSIDVQGADKVQRHSEDHVEVDLGNGQRSVVTTSNGKIRMKFRF
ncbi:MAG: DUF4097 family beta strand repeat-containing protein [Planctomycetota bacterium]